jgi:hypothetical protein
LSGGAAASTGLGLGGVFLGRRLAILNSIRLLFFQRLEFGSLCQSQDGAA